MCRTGLGRLIFWLLVFGLIAYALGSCAQAHSRWGGYGYHGPHGYTRPHYGTPYGYYYGYPYTPYGSYYFYYGRPYYPPRHLDRHRCP